MKKLWRTLAGVQLVAFSTALVFAQDVDWPKHGLDSEESRYSPLKQIRADNVSELGLAWAKKLSTVRGIEATPLVIEGVLYYSLPWSVVQATDAISGATLWTWDPGIDKAVWGRKACCDVVNRGVAYSDEYICIDVGWEAGMPQNE